MSSKLVLAVGLLANAVWTWPSGAWPLSPRLEGQLHDAEHWPTDFGKLRSRAQTQDTSNAHCNEAPETLHLSDPPYQDYFHSNCHSASQVVITTPLPSSNLSLIGPRLLVAWPAGNSGIVSFFSPANGINGTLAIKLKKPSSGNEFLRPLYKPAGKLASRDDPHVGISGVLNFNSSALLTLPILGSIRTIRDFTEGPSILVPEIQDQIKFRRHANNGATLSRVWLDNVTTTHLIFVPRHGAEPVKIQGKKLSFGKGDYRFKAYFNYPQLTQLGASAVLNPESQGLITTETSRTKALSFLSYEGKLLAGAWRFLTYFGRDSMISLLLMQPILSTGKGGAIESVISAVIERINRNSGSVCHEETIGDYATYLNEQAGKTSTKPICSYIMIDSNYYLPIVMNNYFVLTDEGRKRTQDFFAQNATLDFGNSGMSYSALVERNAKSIMHHAAPFASKGGQVKANLRHLKPNQIVGEWRDSTYGIGGGRMPFDVNTGLVPAALRAIASLSQAGFFPSHPEWATTAAQYAQVWEDATLDFFAVREPAARAQSLVAQYVRRSGFAGPAHAPAAAVDYHAIALDGNDGQARVRVMHTDAAFRLFLLNTTHDGQLSGLLRATAAQILAPFPVGLSTDVGLLVANPAFGAAPVYARNWTTADYHGTVVWSWPMAMMASGLERQLGRCGGAGSPAFCGDQEVFGMVKAAYNHLWDLIEKNRKQLDGEVWSWRYDTKAGKFKVVELGTISATESDIRQLWSLTFLAVTRNEAFR